MTKYTNSTEVRPNQSFTPPSIFALPSSNSEKNILFDIFQAGYKYGRQGKSVEDAYLEWGNKILKAYSERSI